MEFDEIAESCRPLAYRDKFRLAQLLIQLGRKEEEATSPTVRPVTPVNVDNIQYVAERLRKLRPSKRSALANSIRAMFQFQGGISDVDVEKFIGELLRESRLSIDDTGRVSFPEVV